MPGRIRTIKPEWLDDQRIARASDGARIMSVALLLLADDYGNGRCDPDSIATRVWPTSLTSLEGIQKVARKSQESLCELTEIRFCGLYSVDGQSYFTIRNWEKHQKVNHPSKPLVPGPPSDFWEQSTETILRFSRDILRVSESLLPDHDHDHDQLPTTNYLERESSPPPAPASQSTTSSKTEHPVKDPKPQKQAKSKKREPLAETMLPTEWQPTVEHVAFAEKHGINLGREVFKFRAHYDGKFAKSWNGKFATWLARGVDFKEEREEKQASLPIGSNGRPMISAKDAGLPGM